MKTMTLENQNKKSRKKSDRGVFLILKLLWAWTAVYGLSRMAGQTGLSDMLLFPKSLLSVFLFGAGFFLIGRMAEDWKENRCLAFWAQLLSAMLCFTELLGTGLRLTEAGVFGKAAEGAQLLTAAEKQVYLDSWQSWAWTVFTAVALSAYLEPFLFRLETFLPTEEACFKRDKKGILSVFFKSWILLFLGYLPCFLAFYPGLYCYDMTWQWDMYWTGDYSTRFCTLICADGCSSWEIRCLAATMQVWRCSPCCRREF